MIKTELILWGPNDELDRNRPTRVKRPCPCGCGTRDGFNEGVGSLSGSNKDAAGFTLFIYDEDTYQHLKSIFGGEE